MEAVLDIDEDDIEMMEEAVEENFSLQPLLFDVERVDQFLRTPDFIFEHATGPGTPFATLEDLEAAFQIYVDKILQDRILSTPLTNTYTDEVIVDAMLRAFTIEIVFPDEPFYKLMREELGEALYQKQKVYFFSSYIPLYINNRINGTMDMRMSLFVNTVGLYFANYLINPMLACENFSARNALPLPYHQQLARVCDHFTQLNIAQMGKTYH